MANNRIRMYFMIPDNDGTLTLGMIYNEDYQKGVRITDQLDKCRYLDKMPLTEALETGAGLINAAIMAAGQYTERVRMAKIQEMAANAVIQPADPLELAKISAYLEGLSLDPSASSVQVQQALEQKEQQDQSPANE